MKISEFINELSNLSGRAKQRMRKWLRSQNGDFCPITQVTKVKLNKTFDIYEYRLAGDALGLPVEISAAIVNAADGDDELTRTEKKIQ